MSKKYMAVLGAILSLVAPVTITLGESVFSDVNGGNANSEAIGYLQENNIVQGYEDNTFRPENTINRAEFLKIVMEAKYAEEDFETCMTENMKNEWIYLFMTDVPKDGWYAKYVCLGKTEGVIQGYPDGTFRPAEEISLVEAAKIIVGTLTDAEVAEDTEQWFRPYVVALGNRWGIPRSIKRFDQKITRGEMAEMVWRLIGDDRTDEQKKWEGKWVKYGELELKRRQDAILAQHPNKTRIFLVVDGDEGEYGKPVCAGGSLIGALVETKDPGKNEVEKALDTLLAIKNNFDSIEYDDFKGLYEKLSEEMGQKRIPKIIGEDMTHAEFVSQDANGPEKFVGLTNQLADSDFSLEKVDISNGVATVNIIQNYLQTSHCEAIGDQIRETILQFPDIQESKIYLNINGNISEGISY